MTDFPLKLKWYIAYELDGQIKVHEFDSREDFLRWVAQYQALKIQIVCAWSEVAK